MAKLEEYMSFSYERLVAELTFMIVKGDLGGVKKLISQRPDLLFGNKLMHYTEFLDNIDEMVELLIELGYDVKEDDYILERFCEIYDSEGDDFDSKERLRKAIMILVKHGANMEYISEWFVYENFGG